MTVTLFFSLNPGSIPGSSEVQGPSQHFQAQHHIVVKRFPDAPLLTNSFLYLSLFSRLELMIPFVSSFR
jgi:hypothetical protein